MGICLCPEIQSCILCEKWQVSLFIEMFTNSVYIGNLHITVIPMSYIIKTITLCKTDCIIRVPCSGYSHSVG